MKRQQLPLVFAAWLMASGSSANASASFDIQFEQNSCETLFTSIASQGGVLTGGADCGEIAAAVVEMTGKYPYWLGCLGYGDMPVASHIARCVMLSRQVRKTEEGLLSGCDAITAFYEESLRAAETKTALPNQYARPSCEEVTQASLIWSGSRPAWIRCRGYDRANEQNHAALCLLGEAKLEQLDSCGKVRAIYEKRLLASYGTLPPGYRPLRCSSAVEIVGKAKAALAAVRSKEHQARLNAAQQRVKPRRAASSIDIEQIIVGLVRLKFALDASLANITPPSMEKIKDLSKNTVTRINEGGSEILKSSTAPKFTASDQASFASDVPLLSTEVIVELEQHPIIFE